FGLTSQRPARSAVATSTKGARAMKARQCSSSRPMSLRSAISEGSPISARSSSRVPTTSVNSVAPFAPLMRYLPGRSLVYPKIPFSREFVPFEEGGRGGRRRIKTESGEAPAGSRRGTIPRARERGSASLERDVARGGVDGGGARARRLRERVLVGNAGPDQLEELGV